MSFVSIKRYALAGERCRIAEILGDPRLAPDEAEALAEVINDFAIASYRIERASRELGYPLSRESVLRHRHRRCQCLERSRS